MRRPLLFLGGGFLQRVVEERDRAGPRHFGTLAKEWELSALGARRTRPQKKAHDEFTSKHCGQRPVRLPPSTGESRTGVPFPRPIPLLTPFG
ncbi:hypothetical protein [Aneurinibacillus soli]|uniref:hypothetical protein n=1 Tax=Aneurinibacillus soli TaxID=1500254 RepID=UPI0012FD02F6|nr:hypothetical protein [Aneurinibacillus soli]